MAFCDAPRPDAFGPIQLNGSAKGARGVNGRMTGSCRRPNQRRRV